MAGESSTIRPAGERQIGKRERPTLKKKKAASSRDERALRISLQIPDRLRAALAGKIDRRIARNLGETRKLRREAMALLQKFLAEAPEDSQEMPEALMRIGELE